MVCPSFGLSALMYTCRCFCRQSTGEWAALSAIQAVHATSKRDQFLMKLRPNFEIARSNLMNRTPITSLDAYLSELLCEEQRLLTQASMAHQAPASVPISVAYVKG